MILPRPNTPPDDEVKLLRRQLDEARKALERARKTELPLQRILAGIKEFGVVVLSPEGKIAVWNEGAGRLFGYDSKEILGQRGRVLFGPDEQARGVFESELAEAASAGRSDDECWLRRKDGSLFWASGVLNPIRGNGGKIEAFVKVFRDLTERRRVEDELRRLGQPLEGRVRERTAELEEALKELGAFAYSIAHDLRSPLRTMAGFARILEEDYAKTLDPTGRGHLRRITSAADRMDKMIQELLNYSQLTRAEITCHPIDPRTVLEETLRQQAADIDRTQAEVALDGPFHPVLAHEVTLGQVFRNLVSNALKFVAPGVRPRVRIRSEPRDDWVRIWVEDNGIGIPPEFHGRIFGMFERLQDIQQYPGTGIGLAIVNRAMERMKGRVGVDSEPGRGSRFWIELPKC